jgi:hypothetical protein
MFEDLPLSQVYAVAKARGAEVKISAPAHAPSFAELAALEESLPGLVTPALLAMLQAGGGAAIRCANPASGGGVAEVRIMSPEEIAGRTRELHDVLRRFGEPTTAPSIVIFAQYFGEYYCFSKSLAGGTERAVFTSDYDGLINYEKNTNRIAGDEREWLSRMFAYYIAGGEDFAYWVPRP